MKIHCATGVKVLRPQAREELAKVSGIVLAYPGPRLAPEGHTDRIGSDEFNQTLSEKPAGNVRDHRTAQDTPMVAGRSCRQDVRRPIRRNDQKDRLKSPKASAFSTQPHADLFGIKSRCVMFELTELRRLGKSAGLDSGGILKRR